MVYIAVPSEKQIFVNARAIIYREYEEGAEPFAAMTAVALKKLVRDNLL